MSQGAAKGVSGTVLVGMALGSGALYGVAAQTLLRHFGWDLSSVHAELMTGQTAPFRLAMAWWIWWIAAALAFFIGRWGAALTRWLAANWWLYREARLLSSAVLVLALAAVGQLPAHRPDFDSVNEATIALGILLLSSALAGIGGRPALAARQAGTLALQIRSWRRRAWSPLRSLPLVLHGGGMNAGLPFRGMRYAYSLAGASVRSRRRALITLLIAVAVAGACGVGSASIVLN